MTKAELDILLDLYHSNVPWIDWRPAFKAAVDAMKITEAEPRKPKGTRTSSQNAALHLWLSLVAEELDKQGHTLQAVVKAIQKAEVRPTGPALKEVMWRPYQVAALQKESTTELTKQDVDVVYEGLNKFLGEQFLIHVPFPSDDEKTGLAVGGRLYSERVMEGKMPEYPDPDSDGKTAFDD